jgi:hypothetical protein
MRKSERLQKKRKARALDERKAGAKRLLGSHLIQDHMASTVIKALLEFDPHGYFKSPGPWNEDSAAKVRGSWSTYHLLWKWTKEDGLKRGFPEEMVQTANFVFYEWFRHLEDLFRNNKKTRLHFSRLCWSNIPRKPLKITENMSWILGGMGLLASVWGMVRHLGYNLHENTNADPGP